MPIDGPVLQQECVGLGAICGTVEVSSVNLYFLEAF